MDKLLCLLLRLLGTALFLPTVLTEGQLRLVGGSSRCEGRVEVYHSGKWGTVCDDSWHKSEAKVVCRQLGCGTGVLAAVSAAFGQGSGPIWLDDVHCFGNESSLTQCGHSGFGKHNCRHNKDAGVFCSGSYIRLVSPGSSRCSGRVEVYKEDEWGTVCDDDWDMTDAEVVCRDMDCGPAVMATTLAKFGEGSGQIFLDDVQCSGNERSFFHCANRGVGQHDCSHSEDAGVVCADNVRLVGSVASRCSGRVEVYHNGAWGTVCSDGWDMFATAVVCKQLNCLSVSGLGATSTAAFGPGTGNIWMDDVDCNVSDQSLTQCRHRGFGVHDCDHSKDVGVICV